MKEKRKRGTKELQNKQETINKLALVSTCLSIIILNVKGLHLPIKKYRVAERMEKNKTRLYDAYKRSCQL